MSRTRVRTFRWRNLTLSAATCLTLGTTAAQGAVLNSDLYAERTVMREADTRCRLFDPVISQALQLGQVQARNAILRAGGDENGLSKLTRAAEARGGSISCNDKALTTEAKRIRSAFSAYIQISRMSFPGPLACSRSRQVWLAHGRSRLACG